MSQYRGSTFVRSVIALAESPGVRNALTVAQRRWGATSQVVTLMKAAVAAGSLHDDLWAGSLAESRGAQLEFLEVVRPLTIVGRLANLRRVPVKAPIAAQSAGAVSYWVGEGKIKPVTSAAFNRTRLGPTKVAGLLVVSEELITFGPTAEITLRDDLANAIAVATDSAFIDPGNSGIPNQQPAAVTAGAVSIPSSGSTAEAIRADVERAIAAFAGSLMTAAWVMHPRAAVAIGMTLSSSGEANDLGALGGTLAGLPVITSEGVPYDSSGTSITLLDAASILYAEDGIQGARSDQTAILMSDTPGSGPAQMVSLWQTNSIALRVERTVNWTVGRANAVVTITGFSTESFSSFVTAGGEPVTVGDEPVVV